jgi:hypothetical protein
MSKNAIAEKTASTIILAPITGEKVIQPLSIVSEKKEISKVPNIEELKNRALTLHLLKTKHDSLTEKRTRLEHFAIVHDQNNAQILIRDANGEEFKSSSPKSIKKLIEFWKEEFAEVIEEIETDMFNIFD